MSRYRGRREFRAGRAIFIIIVLAEMLFLAGALMTYREQGWNWVSLTFAGMAVLGLAGIVESLIVRVQLTDEALLMTDLRGTRSYPRSQIQRVEQGKGVPTVIVLADGNVIRLPPVGSDIGNSIRAWLQQP